MRHRSTLLLWMLAAAIVTGGGCNCGDAGSAGPDAGAGDSIASSRAKLRFKNGARLANDYAQALGLATSELCNELGQYSCVDDIHQVSLLGVEPYELGFYEPMKETAVTTPIAVERVAVAGCSERVERDFASPGEAVIFKDLALDDAGALADVGAPAVAEAIDALYRRALQRHATAAEIAHYRQLYADVAALGGAEPARQWAKASCFAALTTLESLFY